MTISPAQIARLRQQLIRAIAAGDRAAETMLRACILKALQ